MNNKNISNKIRALKLQGFGGMCGKAAVEINEKVFLGKGRYVAAVNKFLWNACDMVIGHFAVEYDGTFWDADAEPKEGIDIESWGMVDPEDPDFKDIRGWNDEAAEEVEWLLELTKEEVLDLMPGR